MSKYFYPCWLTPIGYELRARFFEHTITHTLGLTQAGEESD